MNTIVINALSIFGTFLILYLLIRRFIGSMISGGLQPIYNRIVRWRTGAEAQRKFGEEDPEAWEELLKAKFIELQGGSLERRLMAVDYLRQVEPQPGWTEVLITSLKLQPEPIMQKSVAQLLCKALDSENSTQKDVTLGGPSRVKPLSLRSLSTWTIPVSVWITGLIWLPLIWSQMGEVDDHLIIGLSIIGLIGMLVPLAIQAPSRLIIVTGIVVIGAFVLGGLWLSADIKHVGIEEELFVLNGHGLDGVTVKISYPRWLTSEDINLCRRPVVTTVTGPNTPGTLVLDYDDSIANIRNENCLLDTGAKDLALLRQKPHALFWSPKELASLRFQSIVITPQIHIDNPAGTVLSLSDHSFQINLEPVVWHWLRLTGRAFGSSSAIALIVFGLLFLFKKLT